MKQMIRLLVGCLMAMLIFLPVSVGTAQACVGKTLVIGAATNTQQQVLAQLLAVLISERTGTTVKVVEFENHQQIHQALLKADLDMYIEYTGAGQIDILHAKPLTDAKTLYQAVKTAYNQDLNLIWLKPLGFQAVGVTPAGVPAEAAPVVRKDTLKKFPALARLINKLGGRVDAEEIHKLEAEAASQTPRRVARTFLKQERLI